MGGLQGLSDRGLPHQEEAGVVAFRETDPRNLIHFLDVIKEVPASTLLWADPPGLGICLAKPVEDLYGPGYWSEYRKRDHTNMGALLTAGRIGFCKRFGANVFNVDIGIGGGRFVLEEACMGYDVNPSAIVWLKARGLWYDVTQLSCDSMTFFDSLEHSADWRGILLRCRNRAIVSTPIYSDAVHCRRSKHFKPGEHIWYFTESGLIWYMKLHGFALEGFDHFETRLGREEIGTYCFKRVVG
jgi:hypothetical protein